MPSATSNGPCARSCSRPSWPCMARRSARAEAAPCVPAFRAARDRPPEEACDMTTRLRVLSASDTAELEQVRQFFRHYAAWLGVDLSYQGFGDEVANLPGAYGEADGRLFFAEVDGRPAGCVGVRRFSEGVCEMKRLYVDPDLRGQGLGRKLA